MACVNRATLIGRLGNDPTYNELSNKTTLAAFNLATSKSWRDKSTGEKKEQTQWHRVVCFGDLTKVVKNYLHKGSNVYIEGEIKYRKYQDNGQEKNITEIVASDIQLLEKVQKPENQGHDYAPAPNFSSYEFDDF